MQALLEQNTYCKTHIVNPGKFRRQLCGESKQVQQVQLEWNYILYM